MYQTRKRGSSYAGTFEQNNLNPVSCMVYPACCSTHSNSMGTVMLLRTLFAQKQGQYDPPEEPFRSTVEYSIEHRSDMLQNGKNIV